jgi:hypothetical protein
MSERGIPLPLVLSGWLGWNLVVAIVEMGLASIIYFPTYGFDLDSESTSN